MFNQLYETSRLKITTKNNSAIAWINFHITAKEKIKADPKASTNKNNTLTNFPVALINISQD